MTNQEYLELFEKETLHMQDELLKVCGKTALALTNPVTLNGKTLKGYLPFENNARSYSEVASWAVWGKNANEIDPNAKSYAPFILEKLKEQKRNLNPAVIFLGLNAGAPALSTDKHGQVVQQPYEPYGMFHTVHGKPNSHKEFDNLWPAINSKDSNLAGGYITDFFKVIPTSDGGGLNMLLKNMSPDDRKNWNKCNISILKKECALLGAKKHLIIVMQSVGRKNDIYKTMEQSNNMLIKSLRDDLDGKGLFENGYRQGYIDHETDSVGDFEEFKKSAAAINTEHTFLYDSKYVVCWVPHYSGYNNEKTGTVQARIKRAIDPINKAYDKLMKM